MSDGDVQPLTARLMTPHPVTLRPMTEAEYDAWYPRAVNEYAEDHIRAGSMPADKAHEMAAKQFAELLPDGQTTPAHHLLIGEVGEIDEVDEVDEVRVGFLWLHIPVRDAAATRPVNAFVYDVEVDAGQRGRGYGRVMMVQAEAYAAAHGAATIKLHVFGDNTVARSLYQSLGYVETNVNMAKQLSPVG